MITFLGISVRSNGQVIQSLGYVTRCTESEYTCLPLLCFGLVRFFHSSFPLFFCFGLDVCPIFEGFSGSTGFCFATENGVQLGALRVNHAMRYMIEWSWLFYLLVSLSFLLFFLLVTDFQSLSSTQTSSTGLKTRHFNNIITELSSSLRIHAACNSRLNGVSLEFTGEVNDEGYSVTECVGGSMELNEGQLGLRYQVGIFFLLLNVYFGCQFLFNIASFFCFLASLLQLL